MKPIYSALLLFGLSVILWGCPFESSVGLDDYSIENVNSNLLGTWHKTDYPSDSTEVIFEKKSDHEYNMKATIGNSTEGYSHYNLISYFSKINDGWLLNVFNSNDPAYYFAEILLSGNTLTIRFLSDEITTESFETSADLRKFIEQLYKNNLVKYDEDYKISGLIKVQ